MRLDDVTCVVTGASRGIGRATADALAREGARVAVCGRDADAAREVAAMLHREHGVEAHGDGVDVTDVAGLRAFAAAVQERLGPATVLVNNAGVLGPVGGIDVVDLDEWHATLRTDVAGVANATAVFVPQMRAAGTGSIINLSGGGIGGPHVPARISAYVASKAAVVALTEALASELADARIRVNAVAPGAVGTEFMHEVLERGPDGVGAALYEATVASQDVQQVPDAFLDLVLFLASDASSWLSGRLVTARWDPVQTLGDRRERIEASSLLKLRRIDDDLYSER